MTFLRKLHFHPLLLLFILLSLMTGTFVQLFILLMIIFIHELGHYMMATYFQWRIHQIVLWVFGGVMKTDESTNRPIKEDVIVTLAGPVQHVFIFIVIYLLSYTAFLPEAIEKQAFYFNGILLLFNLLPIYPLDGGKLLFYLLSSVFPFKKAHQMTYRFSILACCGILVLQLFLFPFTLSAFLLFLFLIWENRTEWKNHTFIFMRFLLNRRNQLKKEWITVPAQMKLIDIFYLFRRNRTYCIYIKNNQSVLTESQCLHYYFTKSKIKSTISDLSNDS